METIVRDMTDEQAIAMMRDFVRTQEKLRKQRDETVKISGRSPRYTHYTLSETTLDTVKELFAA